MADFPLYQPHSEADLRRGLDDGLVGETHWLDCKRQLAKTKASNTDFAKDVAAFSLDGGVVLIGVAEDKETKQFHLEPQPLAGLTERIEDIARTKVDPPVAVRPYTFSSENDPSLGFCVVTMEPSPTAPHAVGGTYYGRGETTNRRLPDAEVARLHQRRVASTDLGFRLLNTEVSRDPVPRTGTGRLYLVAEPLGAARDAAWGFIRSNASTAWLTTTSRSNDVLGFTDADKGAPPRPALFQYVERRADGLAATTELLGHNGRRISDNPRWHSEAAIEQFLYDAEFRVSGGVRLLAGQATKRFSVMYPTSDLTVRQGEAPYINTPYILRALRRFLMWSGSYAEQFNFHGQWIVGLRADGLEGLPSADYWHRNADELEYSSPTPYDQNVYDEVTLAMTSEVQRQPWGVAERLIARLLWTLDSGEVHQHLVVQPPATT